MGLNDQDNLSSKIVSKEKNALIVVL
ncbi:MAG: hypothetical protein HW396_159, partial [Candidatus Dadabacteria bacterium]|nr:hypothetical protein [Candidatus Dadabacteria bacterium]